MIEYVFYPADIYLFKLNNLKNNMWKHKKQYVKPVQS